MTNTAILDALKKIEAKQTAQLDQLITPLGDMEEELELVREKGVEAIAYLGETRFEKLVQVAALFAVTSVHRRRLEFQIADLRELIKD